MSLLFHIYYFSKIDQCRAFYLVSFVRGWLPRGRVGIFLFFWFLDTWAPALFDILIHFIFPFLAIVPAKASLIKPLLPPTTNMVGPGCLWACDILADGIYSIYYIPRTFKRYQETHICGVEDYKERERQRHKRQRETEIKTKTNETHSKEEQKLLWGEKAKNYFWKIMLYDFSKIVLARVLWIYKS